MPRGVRLRAGIFVKTTPPALVTKPLNPINGDGPRLWNAKRRIKTSKGLSPVVAKGLVDKEKLRNARWHGAEHWKSLLEKDTIDMEWWKLDSEKLAGFMEAHPELRQLSEDVKEFIQKGSINLDRSKIVSILKSPSRYFAIPHHVPLSMRQQVYFPDPDDNVVLMRTPHLGPRYACFEVPLTFNKLDLKAYLKDVYNVDVLHIRSVVIQQKIERKEGRYPYSQGQMYRPPSQKKMTCLLAKPFVYPEEPESLEPWEYTDYWKSMKSIVAKNREESQWGDINPDQENRKSIALQAAQLLKGKTKWAPTWQNFEESRRVMGRQGEDVQPPEPTPQKVPDTPPSV